MNELSDIEKIHERAPQAGAQRREPAAEGTPDAPVAYSFDGWGLIPLELEPA